MGWLGQMHSSDFPGRHKEGAFPYYTNVETTFLQHWNHTTGEKLSIVFRAWGQAVQIPSGLVSDHNRASSLEGEVVFSLFLDQD